MCKAAFIHDHRFVEVDGTVFSMGHFPASAWQRYLNVFDHVFVVSRTAPPRSLSSRLSQEIASRDGVSFDFTPDLSSRRKIFKNRTEARRIIRSNLLKADVCIVRLPSQLGMLAIREAHSMGLPVAAEVAGCAWDAMFSHGTLAGKLYAPVMWLQTRHAVRTAQFVLYVTNKFLQKRYPPATDAIVECCSNVEVSVATRNVIESRNEDIDNRAEGKITLGLIGSLSTNSKGIQTVIEALPYVRNKMKFVEFRVLGAGDQAPWVSRCKRYGVSEVVYFDGVLPAGDGVTSWLDGIDIYLQPSLKEGLPRALIEAMSRGCPAIGTRCGGIPELIDLEDTVATADVSGLARKIVDLAEDVDWQKRSVLRNWHRSKDYERTILENRRYKFWSLFASEVKGEKALTRGAT